ncbi:MAG TPA: lasso RiPP family leader peptide-containing protein [Longimicrobium sp.]|nr:lasso RiPP family leader peptide-containing protein [Longimicrobium sp.]
MKKIYSRPVLAELGRAAEQTRGRLIGELYDYLGGYRKWIIPY